ncbi:conjugal transfer protein TraG [Pistricoccus aurantiacus]|uniref:Conjugal transfer protein TraG n=1 Tax=Pistricoccus aurantiacus TaxID=1883414 RepID=A0A5B8SR02_9GAMM|nr:conjugal transfer protein TraG N-terminal domain-containing protein [Pistricoccus aurantiacus]QEA38664.1 conjugal transfer protein TraG [Pistricoccus aurantiacus]
MEMAIIICLPFVMAVYIYSFKVAGMATFGLFALWFLTFWWEPARWINSNLMDLLYCSNAAKLSFLSVANNLYDRMVLQFVEGMMFLVLPGLWVGVLGWAGMRVDDSLGRSVTQSTSSSQSAGQTNPIERLWGGSWGRNSRRGYYVFGSLRPLSLSDTPQGSS